MHDTHLVAADKQAARLIIEAEVQSLPEKAHNSVPFNEVLLLVELDHAHKFGDVAGTELSMDNIAVALVLWQ